MTCWEAREKGRTEWAAEHGGDTSAWPVPHPPFVLHLPQIYWAACLGCTWVVRGGVDPLTAQALAASHAAEYGARGGAETAGGGPTGTAEHR